MSILSPALLTSGRDDKERPGAEGAPYDGKLGRAPAATRPARLSAALRLTREQRIPPLSSRAEARSAVVEGSLHSAASGRSGRDDKGGLRRRHFDREAKATAGTKACCPCLRYSRRVNASRFCRFCVRIALIVVLPQFPTPAAGQDSRDTQGWVEYQYRQRINDALRGSWGLGYRKLLSTEDYLSDWSRLHLRGFLTYEHSPRISFEAGLGAYYGLQEPQSDLFELRPWQSVVVRWPEFKLPQREFGLQHRVRFEQRWLRRSGADTEFGTRLRYRLTTGIPLNSPTIEVRTLYLPLGAEWFHDIGDDTSEFFAARARSSAGLAYVLSDNWSLEFRYTAQRSHDTILNRFTTTDHIFDLRIRTTLRLRDLGTPW